MVFSENLASFDHWNFRPSLNDSWVSEAFARDTETLTKALQKSLSSAPESGKGYQDPYLNLMKSDPSPTGSGSDIDSSSKRRNPKSNGKIAKRKSRATKRNPTTFITADPANFRQMVQQVTGIRLAGNSHVPVNHILKPVPHPPGNHRIQQQQNCSLPTLETSTFLMETNTNTNRYHHNLMGPTAGAQVTPVTEGGVGLELDGFQSFPTLESWRLT